MSAGMPGKEWVAANVSHETFARLEIIAELLAKWQKTINLVAPASLPRLWTRHVADSLQLINHVPQNIRRWADLGSGGGFPGLVVAAALAERAGADVHLVESDSRKAVFLREAARLARLPVTVHSARIEAVAKDLAPGTEVVSARALAPLSKLLEYAAPFLAAGALGLFPKGRDAAHELTEACKGWTLALDEVPSLSDPEGRILIVRGATPGTAARSGPAGQASAGAGSAGPLSAVPPARRS